MKNGTMIQGLVQRFTNGSNGAWGPLLRNIVTIVLLLAIPLIGIVAVWTIAPWNRRTKWIVTALFTLPALYRPFLILGAFLRAA